MFWYNCLHCAISWDYARLIYLLLNSLNKLKEIFNKTKVEEKQELIHMMNIVGNQSTHEAADHYGWKDGSTEKLLLHGAIGALTGTMSGGDALSGAVSGSVTGDRNTGAYTAQMGTKWNLFGMEVTEEEQEQTEEILNSMGMKIGEIMTGNDREYIKEKFSESALDGATALAEWTKKTLFRNNGKHLKAN